MSNLRSKRDAIKAKLDETNERAQAAWTELQAAKDAYAGSDAGEDSDAFAALDEQGRVYGELADEVATLRSRHERLLELSAPDAPERRADPTDPETRSAAERKPSPAERITGGEEYKRLADSGRLQSSGPIGAVPLGKAMGRDEVKALITGASDTSGGAFVQNDRQGYYPLPLRPVRLLDLITTGSTNSDTVEYVLNDAFTNSAAETAEATAQTTGTKPESSATFAVVQAPVQNIAAWMAVTRRALADAGQLQTVIDYLLRQGIQLRLESQIVSGNGSAPNLRGITNTSGINAISSGGGGSISDRVHKGITEIRLDYFEPNAVAIHPTDWETVRLSRDDSGATAGTGGYLFGPPSLGEASTLWGLRVVPTTAVSQGTVIVADWSQMMLWVREGVQVLASDSHSDFFIKNLVAILSEGRFAAGIPYPSAFCKVATS